jgi:hypothetical protein
MQSPHSLLPIIIPQLLPLSRFSLPSLFNVSHLTRFEVDNRSLSSSLLFVNHLYFIIIIIVMRWGFLSTLALVALGVVANPVQEESSMTVGIAETVSCDGSHFIVSVQRYSVPIDYKLIFVGPMM